MPEIIIYSKASCPYCELTKNLFEQKHVSFQEIRIDLNEKERDIMIERSGKRTVPQIFINGKSIGGYDDLANLEKSGKLDALLHSD